VFNLHATVYRNRIEELAEVGAEGGNIEHTTFGNWTELQPSPWPNRLRCHTTKVSSFARNFLFLNVPPTSRSPFFIAQGEATVEQHAAYLEVYNQQLESMVTSLGSNSSGVSYP
jgi:hypothetical protein